MSRSAIISAALQSCNDTFVEVKVSDINIKKMMEETKLSEIECKLIITNSKKYDANINIGMTKIGVEVNVDVFLNYINKVLKQRVSDENEKNKHSSDYQEKIYVPYTNSEEHLDMLGYTVIEKQKFYFKKPNLGENKAIKEAARKDNGIDYETLAMQFLIQCAYYDDKDALIKKRVFTDKHMEMLKTSEPNNAFLPTALKYWIQFTLEKSYLGLEPK